MSRKKIYFILLVFAAVTPLLIYGVQFVAAHSGGGMTAHGDTIDVKIKGILVGASSTDEQKVYTGPGDGPVTVTATPDQWITIDIEMQLTTTDSVWNNINPFSENWPDIEEEVLWNDFITRHFYGSPNYTIPVTVSMRVSDILKLDGVADDSLYITAEGWFGAASLQDSHTVDDVAVIIVQPPVIIPSPAPAPTPTPITSLSVSLSADQSTLSGSGRVMLTAVTSRQNISDNLNYTFYCDRSDTGKNITSGYIAKFDNRSEATQYTSCSYGQAGVYTAKVIVNSGNKTAQDQITITVVNQKPIGYHDSVDNNTCRTTGWAYDPDDSSKSINVHIYRDGPAGGGGVILDSFPTNVFRDDANKQEKISGNHGFDANLAPYISDGKSHKLYVYPIDTTTSLGSPSNPLNRTPKTIQCSAPAPIPGKTPPSVDIKVQ